MAINNKKVAFLGSIFYFKKTATMENVPRNKKNQSEQQHYEYIEDGMLVVENGKIVEVGKASEVRNKMNNINNEIPMAVVDYKGKLITPGFIDTHQHSTQSTIVAAYGEKLLEWLEEYVFPGESSFSDPKSARKNLNFFIDQLLQNGTTTAVSYGPLFYEAADIFFEELDKRKMRFITGNIIMDFNSPDTLRLTTEDNYENCQKLIKKWHHKNRLSYCISPRFALACSDKMLELCGSLKQENPDCYIQTHLDENLKEVENVKKRFTGCKNYLEVYNKFGLVTDRSVFGHCVHTKEDALKLLRERNSILSWCPVSNNFLGSGLFNFKIASKYTDKITLGTDWGGGNTLSMFAVLDDAYKVSMLNSFKLPSMVRWYMATLGAARALHLGDKIGSLEPGYEADFIVIDPDASPYMKYRHHEVKDIFDLLFMLMTLGEERNISATYICGDPAFLRQQA